MTIASALGHFFRTRLRLRHVFALQPPSLIEFTERERPLESNIPDSWSRQLASLEQTWQKIRFDNTIRVSISVPTVAACVLLRLSHVIPTIFPIIGIFVGFSVIMMTATWLFMQTRFGRRIDFLLCVSDLIAISLTVQYTGGPSSPVYFIYFVPLIIHSFHRDFALVILNGFGGVVLYAAVIASYYIHTPTTGVTELFVRLFFMLLTMSMACLSVNLLRQKDRTDRLRLLRLKMITAVSNELNQIHELSDLPSKLSEIVGLINAGFGSGESWSRILMSRDDPALLRALEDPLNRQPAFKQEIPAYGCPAVRDNRMFAFNGEGECPIENFSFGSHLCLPVAGSGNETYGVLFAGHRHRNFFGSEERQYLTFISRSIGLCAQRLRRMDELRRSVEMNSCVVGAFIASTRSTKATCDVVLEGALAVLHGNQARLMFWNSSEEMLETVAIKGPSLSADWNARYQLGEGIPGRAMERNEPVWTVECEEEQRHGGSSPKAMICFPLRSLRQEPMGMLIVSRLEKREAFNMPEVDIGCTFAVRAALAIENAKLHEMQRQLGTTDGSSPGVSRAA